MVAIVCAAVAGGIGRWSGGAGEPVQADELAPVAIASPAPTAHAGELLCDGSEINTNCTLVEGNEPGPVVALGYGTEAQAKFHCAGGTVITLYRRGLIVGYGCEK